jgi:hypothetical protein
LVDLTPADIRYARGERAVAAAVAIDYVLKPVADLDFSWAWQARA